MTLLSPLYHWTQSQAAGRNAVIVLAGVSFLESSIFPVPPDIMLVPLCLAERKRCFYFAAVCTIASIAGGLLGYAIGYFLYATLGRWIIEAYGYQGAIASFQEMFSYWGLWIILIKGLTPIPYKLVTIASGVAQFNIPVFLAGSLITRGARFYLEAAILWRYGPPIRAVLERRLNLVTWSFLAIVVGGVVVLYAM